MGHGTHNASGAAHPDTGHTGHARDTGHTTPSEQVRPYIRAERSSATRDTSDTLLLSAGIFTVGHQTIHGGLFRGRRVRGMGAPRRGAERRARRV